MVNAAAPGTFLPPAAPTQFRPPNQVLGSASGEVQNVRESATLTKPASTSNQKQTNLRVSKPMVIGGVFLILLLVGIAIASLLSQSNQDVRQKAYTGDTSFFTPTPFPSPTPVLADASNSNLTVINTNSNSLTSSPSPFSSPSPTPSPAFTFDSSLSTATPSPTPMATTSALPRRRRTTLAQGKSLPKTGNVEWTYLLLLGGLVSLIGGSAVAVYNRRRA